MYKVAVITMVRNDDFFLSKWVSYYATQLGIENLYIFFDGKDQIIPDFCKNANVELVEKIGSHVVDAEKGRLKFISQQASRLFLSGYDAVIGVDADEYIVVDPNLDISLKDYIFKKGNGKSLSPLGLDFGQKIGEEKELTLNVPFLSQRKYAQIGTRYTKPSILYRPAVWGSGFHRIKGKNFYIAKDLFLMHFGYSDMGIIEKRFEDKDRINQGWGKHIFKRSRTIRFVSKLQPRSFHKWTKIARYLESVVRPPYAWNKPGLLGMRIIVEIPSRFRDVL